MFKKVIIFILFGILLSAQSIKGHQGKEFVFSFIPNFPVYNSSLALYMTSKEDTRGVVEIPGIVYSQAFDIKKNEVTKVELPSAFLRDMHSGYCGLLGCSYEEKYDEVLEKSVFIYTEKDIIAYAFNRQLYTTDGFLLIPKKSLGYEYIAVGYESLGMDLGLRSIVSIAAAYDNTEIVITPNETSYGHTNHIPFTVTLNRGEIYAFGARDVTGTHIRSTYPVSVTSGHNRAYVPTGFNTSMDHLVENIPPIVTWGKSYIAVPFAKKSSDLFRVVSSQDGTVVKFNGVEEVRLSKGEVYETITGEINHIETSNPCMVAQYMLTSSWDNVQGSDPMLVILPSVEQYKQEYIFTALSKSENAQDNYVNVTIPTEAIATLQLDGNDVNSSLFSQVADTAFSAAQIKIASGSHTIKAAKPFGIVVYGMGDYESYGYIGGSDFKFINNQTDKYKPSLLLQHDIKLIRGIVNDDEDINQNGVLELEEDLNKNGKTDRRTEDINGNNILDEGEDEDGDGLIDIDGGIYRIVLDENATNVQLNVQEYIPGSTRVEFTISLIDQNKPGSGTVIVSDGAGNLSQEAFVIPVVYHNVEVVSTLLTDGITLDASSFSVVPESITTDSNKTEIVWKFEDFNMTQVENLDYEITLDKVFAGDTKIITQKLQVNYRDLRGKEINITLGEQHIKVLSPLANVTIDTDRDIYASNQEVHMDVNVTNTNTLDYSLKAKVSIYDASDILVQSVDEVEIAKLQSGESVGFSVDWNTTNILAGNYFAKVELVDTNGNFVDIDSASFTIVSAYNSNETISLDSSTFGYEFKTTDTVIITNIIENNTLNTPYDDMTLKAVMTKPDGSEETIYTKSISTILPRGTLEEQINQTFVHAAEGVYGVKITLVDKDGTLLSMDSVSFELVHHQEDTLLGSTSALYAKMTNEQIQRCTDKIRNFGTTTLSDQKIRQRLFNLQNGFIISESVSSHTLEANAGNVVELERTYVKPLKEGAYSCLLETMMEGEWKRLDNAVFEVKAENYNAASIFTYTDKSDYGPDETIALFQKVENYSSVEGTYYSRIEIIDSAGEVVKVLTSQIDTLPAHAIDTYQFDINTSSIGIGDYTMKAYLYDDADTLMSQSSSVVKILGQAPMTSLNISIAKETHYNTDLANIFVVATNHNAGEALHDVNVLITVWDTQGLVIYEHNRSLGDLDALETEELNEHFRFENLDIGLYRVQAQLYISSRYISTASTTFEVEKVISNGLTGSVGLDAIIVAPGEDVVCHYRVVNSEDIVYSNQEVKTLLLDTNEQIIEEQTDYHTIQPKETLSLDSTIETADLMEGSYRCQLETKIDDRWRILDTKSFTVYKQAAVSPTEIEEDNGSKILILLDEQFCTRENSSTPEECTSADPYGPSDAPSLDAQRAYLEALLRVQGYRYDIVTDSQSFAYHLRTGKYKSYVILSEQLDLSKETQKELREAIYKGENILFAGTHYRKNIYLLTALGIDIKGECKQASGYTISGSSLLESRSDDFVLSEKVLHVVDRGASVIGYYEHCDCSAYTTAVTEYTYGLGHALFVGFDLLAQATKAGEDSSYKALLSEMLQVIVPRKHEYLACATIPLKIPFSVENGVSRGIIKLETNKGRLTYDKSVIQKRGKLILVPFELSGTSVEHFGIRLPEASGEVEIKTTLQSMSQSDLPDQDVMHKTLEIQHLYTYDAFMDMLERVDHSKSAIEEIKAFVNKAKIATDHDTEAGALIEASNVFETLHATDPKLIKARIILGHLLRYAQVKQVSFAEHIDERLDVHDSNMIKNQNQEFEFVKHLDPKFTYLKKDK